MPHLYSNKYFLFLVRILIAFVFIYAGAEKITDPEGFATSISNYRLLPVATINLLSIILPWIEIVAGILLLFGISVKENSAIIFFMISVFTMAIVISLFRGLSIDCGCFGKGTEIGLFKLSENILLLLGSVLLIIFDSDFLNLGSD